MSRDWTPQQLHAVDRQMNGSLHEQVITWEYNGETKTIHDPNSEDGKAFPNFYFLGCDVFNTITHIGHRISVVYFIAKC